MPEPIADVTPEPVSIPMEIGTDPALTRWTMQIPDETPPMGRRQGKPARGVVAPVPAGVAAPSPLPPRMGRAAIDAALRQSTVYPTDRDFDRAVVRFPYVPDVLYHLDIGTDAPMLLMFPPGEEVLLVGGLDRKRFVVTEQMERVDGDPTRYKVEAIEAGVCGRLTVSTVKADYFMEVCSHEKPGLVAVGWKHPPGSDPVPVAQTFPAPGLYRIGYRWETPRGHPAPVWNPIWIGDTADHGKTLILFPKERLTTAAPILLVDGPGGTRQVTNGRGRGQWYEVDRQFHSAELRVGHDEHAEVVRIRQEALSWVRCPGDAGCPPSQTLTENPR